MNQPTTSIATPVAHLVGPGKVKVINRRLAFSAKDQSPVRLDPAALEVLICYGPVGISDEAFQQLFRRRVQVVWMSRSGARCLGRMARVDDHAALIRMLQHHAFQQETPRLIVARDLVEDKIQSQIDAARHYQRQRATIRATRVKELEQQCTAAGAASTLQALRGFEGAASAIWFRFLDELLRPPWQFTKRVIRPPTDPVNAILSLGYTWLLNRTVAKCQAAGLEVNLGALHDYRPGRPSLACDLMEPFRVPAVDRWVLAALNGRHLMPRDFVSGDHGVRLCPGRFGPVLAAWEEHWFRRDFDGALDRRVQALIRALRRHGSLDAVG